MTRFVLNLLNINGTHPGLRSVLEKGALTIRRGSRSFSRIPIDMALEQTINADASSRMTGISAFHNSHNTKAKWAITNSARAEVLSALLEKAGLRSIDDETHKENKETRMKRDNSDLNKILGEIESCQNPFEEDVPDELVCITSGKSVTKPVQDDLLKFVDKGKKYYHAFREQCIDDPSRFEKAISKSRIQNFASSSAKCKLKRSEIKVMEVKGTRDLFGRLLFLATSMDIDLPLVFSYPLTPVPLCLAHLDG